MGGQGGPQAYSQEPIYTPRILRDPGEPVNRPSQPHVQFDMGGVRKTGKLCDREFMNSRRCNISHLICHQTQALQANQEHLNEDHRNHLRHHLQEALIRSDFHMLSHFHLNITFNISPDRVLRRDLLVEGMLYHLRHLLLPMSPLTLATLVHIPHEMTKLSLMSITEIVSTFYSKG